MAAFCHVFTWDVEVWSTAEHGEKIAEHGGAREQGPNPIKPKIQKQKITVKNTKISGGACKTRNTKKCEHKFFLQGYGGTFLSRFHVGCGSVEHAEHGGNFVEHGGARKAIFPEHAS